MENALYGYSNYLNFIKDIKKFFIKNIEKLDYEFIEPQLVNSISGDLIILCLEKNEILVPLNCFSKEVSIPKKMYSNSAGYDFMQMKLLRFLQEVELLSHLI